MKVDEFNKNTKHLMECVENILIKKQAEYAEDTDRLANFKQFESLAGKTPVENATDYWLKHVGSIYKLGKDMNKGIFPTETLLEEKCQDAIAYIFLIYNCALELMNNHPQK